MWIEATTSADVVLPASIWRVVELGVRAVAPSRVILYGSRARRDARENSDYDLAFVFAAERRGRWLRFVADLDDAAATLLAVDLLDWNEAPASLREQIGKEGVILYERAPGL
jgi:predicted nucleotidyltransferase